MNLKRAIVTLLSAGVLMISGLGFASASAASDGKCAPTDGKCAPAGVEYGPAGIDTFCSPWKFGC